MNEREAINYAIGLTMLYGIDYSVYRFASGRHCVQPRWANTKEQASYMGTTYPGVVLLFTAKKRGDRTIAKERLQHEVDSFMLTWG